MLIELKISNKAQKGISTLHVIPKDNTNTYYCNHIKIKSKENSCTLITEQDDILLKNNDCIITKDHVIEVQLLNEQPTMINYTNSRSPLFDMSVEWEKKDLFEQINPPNGGENVLFDYCTDEKISHEDDPLSFLETKKHDEHSTLSNNISLALTEDIPFNEHKGIDTTSSNIFINEDLAIAELNNSDNNIMDSTNCRHRLAEPLRKKV